MLDDFEDQTQISNKADAYIVFDEIEKDLMKTILIMFFFVNGQL